MPATMLIVPGLTPFKRIVCSPPLRNGTKEETTVTLNRAGIRNIVSSQRLTFVRLKSFISILCFAAALVAAPVHSFAQQVQAEVKRKVVSRVPPLYPDIARRMQLAGTVKLQVEIEPNGIVGNAKIIGGHPMLAQAAVDAVNKWRWSPASEVTTEIVEINFSPQR